MNKVEERDALGKVLAMENKLYDYFMSLGDAVEDVADGGIYRGHAYEPAEVPLRTVSDAIGFNLTGGWANKRLLQMVKLGLYELRRNGQGKPSFLRILVVDHDEHFMIKGRSRYNEARALAESDEINPNLVHLLDQRPTLSDAYSALTEVCKKKGKSDHELSRMWAAYKKRSLRVLRDKVR